MKNELLCECFLLHSQKGYNYNGNFEVVKGAHEGTTDKWEAEIGAITIASVHKMEDVQRLPDFVTQMPLMCTDVNFTRDEQRAVVSNLLGRMKDVNQIHVHQAALAIYAMVKSAAKEFDADTLKSISDSIDCAQRRFPIDDFLLVVEVETMNAIESLVAIPDSAIGFEYPPFQKGLPFFPDHAYQVTINLARRQAPESYANSLLQLVHAVDGKQHQIVTVYIHVS